MKLEGWHNGTGLLDNECAIWVSIIGEQTFGKWGGGDLCSDRDSQGGRGQNHYVVDVRDCGCCDSRLDPY